MVIPIIKTISPDWGLTLDNNESQNYRDDSVKTDDETIHNNKAVIIIPVSDLGNITNGLAYTIIAVIYLPNDVLI